MQKEVEGGMLGGAGKAGPGFAVELAFDNGYD
jgi:hypothetical protein